MSPSSHHRFWLECRLRRMLFWKPQWSCTWALHTLWWLCWTWSTSLFRPATPCMLHKQSTVLSNLNVYHTAVQFLMISISLQSSITIPRYDCLGAKSHTSGLLSEQTDGALSWKIVHEVCLLLASTLEYKKQVVHKMIWNQLAAPLFLLFRLLIQASPLSLLLSLASEISYVRSWWFWSLENLVSIPDYSRS